MMNEDNCRVMVSIIFTFWKVFSRHIVDHDPQFSAHVNSKCLKFFLIRISFFLHLVTQLKQDRDRRRL